MCKEWTESCVDPKQLLLAGSGGMGISGTGLLEFALKGAEWTWLCKNSSQLVCSYGEAACNWPNPGSPQVALLYGVRMRLVERQREWKVCCDVWWRHNQGVYLTPLLLYASALGLLCSFATRAEEPCFSLCLSWNEAAGVISTSQVFSKFQIEIRFLWFERNVNVSCNFICKHLYQGRMRIAPMDLKCLVKKCSRESSSKAGRTQVCRNVLALNICYLNLLIPGCGSYTNCV